MRTALLILSAISYAYPFYNPDYWWLIFLFLIPLTFIQLHYTLWFSDALLWTLGAFCIHGIAIARGLIQIKHGIMQFIPSLVLIGIFCIYGTTWLLITNRAIHHQSNSFRRFMLWIVSVWFFFWFLDHGFFMLLGRWEGLIFLNPLLVLPPSLLRIVFYFGPDTSLFLWAASSSTVTLFFMKKNKTTGISLSVFLLGWTLIYLHPIQPKKFDLPIGVIPQVIRADDPAPIIAQLQQTFLSNYPELALTIFPEAACNNIPSFCTTPMIIGITQKKGSIRTNKLYFITPKKRLYYEKRHRIPFAEYIPDWTTWLIEPNAQLKKADNSHPRWELPSGLIVVPYICSDLFFNHKPDDLYQDPVLAVCSDWWFSMAYFKKLMALGARLRAVQWHRPIIYVAYGYAQIFDEWGTNHPLRSLPAEA